MSRDPSQRSIIMAEGILAVILGDGLDLGEYGLYVDWTGTGIVESLRQIVNL